MGTLCQYEVDIKIIVMQNNRLGMVKEVQDMLYCGCHEATILDGNPDFVKLAQAYGIEAASATNNEEAKQFAKQMLESKKAYILVCHVDPDTPSI